MNNRAFADFVARRLQQRVGLLSYLAKPYLLLYAGFLGVMVALSFAIPLVHSASMAARWPALGLAAFIGALLPIVSHWRRLTTPHVLLVVFLILLGGSTLYAAEKFYTAQRFASVVMLFAATILGLFVYCRDWKSVVRITDLLWCIGSLLVLVGFVFRAGAGAMGDAGERFEGLHSRATGAGTYAALFLPIAIYQASYRFRGVWQLFGWCVVMLFVLQALLSGARAAVSWQNSTIPFFARIVTGTGPAISSKMIFVVSPVSLTTPVVARTWAVPTVGWPAKGSSRPGVKIRTRAVWAGLSGGRTKVVSEKLNSRAIGRNRAGSIGRASGKTASWFPPNARSVKTSTVMKGTRMSGNCKPSTRGNEWTSGWLRKVNRQSTATLLGVSHRMKLSTLGHRSR